jgi:hypothetical protein
MKAKIQDNKKIREQSIKLLLETLVDLAADNFLIVEKNIWKMFLLK